MQFRTALSSHAEPRDAAREVIESLGENRFDLCLAFAGHDPEGVEAIAGALAGVAEHTVVTSAGGALAAGTEVEQTPSLSVFAAQLGPASVRISKLGPESLPNPDAPPSAWREMLGVESPAGMIVLADPFTCPVDDLLTGLDYAFGRTPKVGGLISGGTSTGSHRLIVDGASSRDGAVVLSFDGPIVLESVVAQGCRPFGKAGQVTNCEGSYLVAVDGKPSLRFLEQQLEENPDQRSRVERAPLFLGIAMDPFEADPHEGDYLIRNLAGVDRSTGMLAIAGELSVGRKVQFHIRDAEASEADLRAALSRVHDPGTVSGALMFSCLGRGVGLYGTPNQDSALVQETLPDAQLAGFFCNGEIGAVGGQTYVHGYTATIALFREPR